jgi:adenylate cyclase
VGHVPDSTSALLEAWQVALALYRARDFGQAEQAFRRVLDSDPDDGPARVYIERCARLRANPPSHDWN